jgi:hypothetical protein
MADDKAFLDAVDQADAQIGAQAESVGDDIKSACAQYQQMKPTIQTVVSGIEFIPGFGKKVGKIIRFLMSLADTACGAVTPG